ncbi:E3 ubiquitin-protein ligase rfwd3.S-like isoform X1 [Mytilus edulis]|uniref:E3 ubiquitin-protein ligase rfwd3.S-like isoform X1 n=1 Tax=Mytilus edulis TaxID=6550 RepID=UPI0039EE7739
MSDIDVEGSDDEIIVVTESPERHIDIDVEAVTDEELFPDSEGEDNDSYVSIVSEVNVEDSDDEDVEVDVDTLPNHEENQQVLPSVGAATVVDSETRSSRSTLPGVITLPPLPSLNLETNAETSVESITNITIQSNAVTTMDSVHNITMQPITTSSSNSLSTILSSSSSSNQPSTSVSMETTGNGGPHSSPHQPSTSVTMETTGSSVPHSASYQPSTSAAPVDMGTTGSGGFNSSPNQPSTSSAASVAMETAGNGGPNLGATSTLSTVLSSVSATNAVQVIQGHTDSPRDFRSPKRRRIMTPEKPGGGEPEDEGNCCPICFEEWTSSGNHRLASLKCGHLFGQSCIDKWLKGQGGKCPQCNSKAKRQDIRVLYAKCLKVVDTTERDRALQDLEKEKEGRRRSEMEAAQIRMQYQMTVGDNNKLRTEIAKLREQLQNVRSQPSQMSINSSQSNVSDNHTSTQSDGQFILDKTIKIWDGGNCRVMAYSPSLATLVVSQPSASSLFPGFGIKKISTLDFKTSQYLTIHSKTIRDVSFHPNVDDGILLSCALDKTVKMTSVISNAVVQTYETQLPSWSCVWNADDRNFFYVGMQNGRVLEYDIRNTIEHVQELNTEGSRSPVASLQYVPSDMNAMFRCGGLLVGQLDKVSFYEKKQDQHKLHILPVEGSLSSQCFEPNTRHLLCSFKPSQKHAAVRHQLCEMNCVNISGDPTTLDMSCSCDIVQTFHAGRTQTLLSKSVLLPHPTMENNMLVCAGEESTQSLHIWDCGKSQLKQRLRTDGAVLDICAIKTNNMTYLAALTDKILKVFKWC